MASAIIPLLQRPPNETGFEAAAEGQNQALNAQSIMQQMQMRKEQIASEQLANEAHRKALADEDIYRRSWTESGGKVDQFEQLMQQRGGNPDHVLAVKKHLVDVEKGYADLDKDKRAILEGNTKALGTTAQALLNLPDDAYVAQLPGAIDDLVARQHLTAEQGSHLKANPPDKNQLGMFASGAKSAENLFEEYKYKEGAPERAAKLAKEKAESLEVRRRVTAESLATAAPKGYDEYARAYYKADPDLVEGFDHPKNYDPEKTPKNAINAGLTPEQRKIAERAETTATATAAYRKTITDLQKRRADQEDRRLAMRGKETAAQKLSARKDAMSRKMKLEGEERKLLRERRGLIEWIKSGKQPTYAGGQPKEPRDFQGELDDLDNTYEQLLTEKYAVAGELGEGPPKVSLEQAIQGVRSGRPGAFETKLTPDEEETFQEWKTKNAPKDSGQDYDLRGAFKAGVKPTANGHWPDTFKKPNHPTFSSDSQYATPDAPKWEGKALVAKDGKIVASEYTEEDIRRDATTRKKDPNAAVALARKRGLIK